MKIKPSFGIIVYGWLEILTLFACLFTLIQIERYPLILLFLPFPVAILGGYTLKLNPKARRLNIYFSPFIVLTYIFLIFIIVEHTLFIFNVKHFLNIKLFYTAFFLALFFHIYFFNRNFIKKQFVPK